MTRRQPHALALAFVLIAAACATAANAQTPAQIARGRALVERNCGMCHAIGRRDTSRNPEAPPFRELHQRFDVEMLGEGLAEGILTGHPSMPEFRFQPDEIVAIIRYLRSIQTKQNVGLDGVPPGAP